MKQYIKDYQVRKNPVDSYDQIMLENILEEVDEDCYLIFSSSSPRSGKFVHIQTAGHVAGMLMRGC